MSYLQSFATGPAWCSYSQRDLLSITLVQQSPPTCSLKKTFEALGPLTLAEKPFVPELKSRAA